ncbi:hypothetical protein F5Y13DRAFT_190152 [Hypoxylon sp. FL1857]|nr:hypothetical protein F5Y13DRAFT_190152 [Hypoxylon sp. FL1857]
MANLGDIKIETAIDVDEVLDHIKDLETGLNDSNAGAILDGWMVTRLNVNLDWISASRSELQESKSKFKDDSETTKKVEIGLNKLHAVETKIRLMIRCSNELKVKQGQENGNC